MQYIFNVNHRNPFSVVRLPLIARLYAMGYRKQRGAYKSLIGRPAKMLFKFLHKYTGLGGKGLMTIDNGESIPFDARNTQFHAIYLPQYIDNYETEVSGLIEIFLPENGVFLDVGANWGYFSLHVASRKNFSGKIHAFEPVEATYRTLSETVSASGYSQQITCHQLALSDSGTSKTIQIEDSIHSGIAAISATGEGVQIACKDLDSMNIKDIDFIKIDVEGHEAEMLKGAEKTILESKPFIIFENWISSTSQTRDIEPLNILAELGYRFFHPTWQHPLNNSLVTTPPLYRSGDEIKLVLTEFRICQRHLFKKQVNIFACPKNSIAQLAAAGTLTDECLK